MLADATQCRQDENQPPLLLMLKLPDRLPIDEEALARGKKAVKVSSRVGGVGLGLSLLSLTSLLFAHSPNLT